jgi:hypothetical protein
MPRKKSDVPRPIFTGLTARCPVCNRDGIRVREGRFGTHDIGFQRMACKGSGRLVR